MAKYTSDTGFWVSEEGHWSQGTQVLMSQDVQLTKEQIEILSSLPDEDRFYYFLAILDEEEDLSEWED